jgi:sodium-dependent dicarboxylate transporter 2/3/5
MSTTAPDNPGQGGEGGSLGDPRWKLIASVLCIAIPLVIYFAPWDIEPNAKIALAVTAFMLVAWMTHVVEYAVAGLAGCLLFWILGVAESRLAFSGFSHPITWFVFAALGVGLIATKSGVPQRVGSFIVTHVGLSYAAILLGLIVTDFALTFIVPTGVGRVVIMASIAIGLIKVFDVSDDSNVARAMFLVITYTATIFDKMILAGAAAITARGSIEVYGGIEVGYFEWFSYYLPANILTVIGAWLVALWFYPPEVKDIRAKRAQLLEQFKMAATMTPKERRAAIIIVGTIVVWMTDWLHHIDPELVALGAVVISLLPYVGVLTVDDLRKMNLMPFFFVGTALSMSNVLEDSGALTYMASTLLQGVEPVLADKVTALPILYWSAFIYHLFLASEIPMLASSLPILMEFSLANNLDPLWIGLVWSFAAGGKIFVYQTAVLVVGYSYGYFRHTDLITMGFVITVIEFLNLILVALFWWPLFDIG